MSFPCFQRWVADSDLILGRPKSIRIGMRLDFLHSVSGSVCVGYLEEVYYNQENNSTHYLIVF